MADHQRNVGAFINAQHNNQCNTDGKTGYDIGIDDRNLVKGADIALGHGFGIESTDRAQSAEEGRQNGGAAGQENRPKNHMAQIFVGKQIDIVLQGKAVNRTDDG